MSFGPTALAAAASAAYVVAIHAWCPPGLAAKDRNHPDVVVHRMRRITGLCGALLAVLPPLLWLLWPEEFPLPFAAVIKFGLIPDSSAQWAGIAGAIALIVTLYVGPILLYAVETRLDPETIYGDLLRLFTTLWGFRDHVFAPASEEFIYRSVVLTILDPFMARSTAVVAAPLLFGFAHVHHAYELLTRHKLPWSQVALTCTFQLTYTTIFGMLASKLFFETRSFWAPCAVHTICNLMGFPETSLDGHGPALKVIYYALLAAGVYGFWYLL